MSFRGAVLWPEESRTASTNHAGHYPCVTDFSLRFAQGRRGLLPLGMTYFMCHSDPEPKAKGRNRGLLPQIMLVLIHALPIPPFAQGRRGLLPLGMTYCGGLAKSVPMECHSEAASAAEESVTVSTNHACFFPRVTDSSLRFAQGRRGLQPLGMTYKGRAVTPSPM
jgi:hypothetical protein